MHPGTRKAAFQAKASNKSWVGEIASFWGVIHGRICVCVDCQRNSKEYGKRHGLTQHREKDRIRYGQPSYQAKDETISETMGVMTTVTIND